jgi:hypothetical protein
MANAETNSSPEAGTSSGRFMSRSSSRALARRRDSSSRNGLIELSLMSGRLLVEFVNGLFGIAIIYLLRIAT